jgi:hypothetical protein
MEFAICLDNEGYEASFEIGKLYQVIPDKEAANHGYIKLIDESGEDYGFTASRFHLLQLPLPVRRFYYQRFEYRLKVEEIETYLQKLKRWQKH